MQNDKRTSDRLMDIRIAAIKYKLDRNLKTDRQFADELGMKERRSSISRFIRGDLLSFDGVDDMEKFFIENGYLNYRNEEIYFFNKVANIFRIENDDIILKKLKSITSCYEYYQWSSTRIGMITISSIEISDPRDNDSFFRKVIERQEDPAENRSEKYYGCCCSIEKGMLFLMHEIKRLKPKVFICNRVEEDFMTGSLLKLGTTKSVHISNVYLRKKEKSDITPRVENRENIEKSIMNKLMEPITSFDLTESGRETKKFKKDLIDITTNYLEALED